ncbi:SH3 domain-containing protein [Paratractidigestivibacter sp.]|uniref:SH3 domain-containing protein n=1 Tax=Paratractidigestivibacter sp. TaxID=2847316 RepID=UPI002AC923A6|nr:SH3 domain-containing protein [Paratractidigestivibacter sp.]
MKVAIYSRGKKLAIREQPSADAPMVGTLDDGAAVVVEEAGAGWLECFMGYIRADLVTVGELYGGIEPSKDLGQLDEQAQETPVEQPQPEQEAEERADDDDNAALKAMKLNELRELAKGSGIALPKNATKAQIIELLTGSDE